MPACLPAPREGLFLNRKPSGTTSLSGSGLAEAAALPNRGPAMDSPVLCQHHTAPKSWVKGVQATQVSAWTMEMEVVPHWQESVSGRVWVLWTTELWRLWSGEGLGGRLQIIQNPNLTTWRQYPLVRTAWWKGHCFFTQGTPTINRIW